ncbi:MAG: formylglycine-generating enzyme family protein, partial [Deltaproteobacteria bacterium]|nr:formylglycine-generating enzyme family protein [Deltaproteobacteria bacterium]
MALAGLLVLGSLYLGWQWNEERDRRESVRIEQEQEVFRDRLKDGGEGQEMVVIQAGRFRRGDIQGGGGNYEKPVHEVVISKSFALGRYEVTFAEYDRFCEATGRAKPTDRGWGRGKRPVINVSWKDAKAYAEWLMEQTGKKYRLPTEAEWEYGARAGSKTKYWWGNAI